MASQRRLLERLIAKIDDNKDDICKYEVINPEAEKMIVSYGTSARSSKDIVIENEDIGMFRLQTVWPFPSKAFRRAVRDKESVLVVEMNEGQMFREVERQACRAGVSNVGVCAKMEGDIPTPEEIMDCLKGLEGER